MVLSIHERIETDRKSAQTDGFLWSDITRFRKYYRGRQRGTLNAEQVRILQSVLGNRFSHNICKKIVTEKSNRLEVARFDVADEAVGTFLLDTWVKNQFPDLFAGLMVAVLRDSNAFIGLNWIPSDDPENLYGGRVSLKVERLWDGKTGVFMQYREDGTPEYAVKEWVDHTTKNRYRTVYFDDHIERYVMDGASWRGTRLPDDPQGSGGFVPWIKRDGKGLGIPIIHFANGSDDDSNYGASELDGGVLGFQDQINAIQHDITAVSMLSGASRTWSKGFELEVDEATQKPKQPRVGPGAHWHSDADTAAWGVLESGDPTPLVESLWVKVKSVCQMTDTPMHAITGDWPSGEALFRAEMSLVQAVETLAKKIGPSLSSMMHLATEITNTFGTGSTLNEYELIKTIFVPVDKRDPLTRAMYAEKVSAFVSEREVLRLLGYSPAEIDLIVSEREQEAASRIEAQQALFAVGATGATFPSNDNPDAEPTDDDE